MACSCPVPCAPTRWHPQWLQWALTFDLAENKNNKLLHQKLNYVLQSRLSTTNSPVNEELHLETSDRQQRIFTAHARPWRVATGRITDNDAQIFVTYTQSLGFFSTSINFDSLLPSFGEWQYSHFCNVETKVNNLGQCTENVSLPRTCPQVFTQPFWFLNLTAKRGSDIRILSIRAPGVKRPNFVPLS